MNIKDVCCKNCKYFEKGEYKKNRGICKNKNKFRYCDECEDDGDTDYDLQYWDYDCYRAGFDVGINFGCKHYEEKAI